MRAFLILILTALLCLGQAFSPFNFPTATPPLEPPIDLGSSGFWQEFELGSLTTENLNSTNSSWNIAGSWTAYTDTPTAIEINSEASRGLLALDPAMSDRFPYTNGMFMGYEPTAGYHYAQWDSGGVTNITSFQLGAWIKSPSLVPGSLDDSSFYYLITCSSTNAGEIGDGFLFITCSQIGPDVTNAFSFHYGTEVISVDVATNAWYWVNVFCETNLLQIAIFAEGVSSPYYETNVVPTSPFLVDYVRVGGGEVSVSTTPVYIDRVVMLSPVQTNNFPFGPW